jgi:rhodanese-related sulfurtransferase
MAGLPVPISLFAVEISEMFFADHMNQALLALMLVSGGLLVWPALRRSGGGLSAAQATQLINRRNAVVLDLRSAEAFAKGHLPAARAVDPEQLAAKLAQLVKNKSTPVLFVCQDGRQSQKAVKTAGEAGYTDAHALQGGLAAWLQAGMPVVNQGVAK